MSAANQFPLSYLAPEGHLLFRFITVQLGSSKNQFNLISVQLFYRSGLVEDLSKLNPVLTDLSYFDTLVNISEYFIILRLIIMGIYFSRSIILNRDFLSKLILIIFNKFLVLLKVIYAFDLFRFIYRFLISLQLILGV